MSPEQLGFVMLAVLLVTIFLGFPMSFTLIIISLVCGYIGFGDLVFHLMVMQAFGFMKEEVLAAVPLFEFMGYVLERCGLMERLFTSFQMVMGPVRGSLYLAVLVASTVFAMATGIIGAPVTVMGLMAVPIMMRNNYDPRLSAGVITAGGCLGILIPPSVMLVVMGPVAGISVIKLLAAATIPGFILSTLIHSLRNGAVLFQPYLGTSTSSGGEGQVYRSGLQGAFP
ncbi:MAG: TRAP transporter large permease subunit [Thermodesulfobacteriota bacterium]